MKKIITTIILSLITLVSAYAGTYITIDSNPNKNRIVMSDLITPTASADGYMIAYCVEGAFVGAGIFDDVMLNDESKAGYFLWDSPTAVTDKSYIGDIVTVSMQVFQCTEMIGCTDKTEWLDFISDLTVLDINDRWQQSVAGTVGEYGSWTCITTISFEGMIQIPPRLDNPIQDHPEYSDDLYMGWTFASDHPLNPIPEPAEIAAVIGIAALAFIAYNRRRA